MNFSQIHYMYLFLGEEPMKKKTTLIIYHRLRNQKYPWIFWAPQKATSIYQVHIDSESVGITLEKTTSLWPSSWCPFRTGEFGKMSLRGPAINSRDVPPCTVDEFLQYPDGTRGPVYVSTFRTAMANAIKWFFFSHNRESAISKVSMDTFHGPF